MFYKMSWKWFIIGHERHKVQRILDISVCFYLAGYVYANLAWVWVMYSFAKCAASRTVEQSVFPRWYAFQLYSPTSWFYFHSLFHQQAAHFVFDLSNKAQSGCYYKDDKRYYLSIIISVCAHRDLLGEEQSKTTVLWLSVTFCTGWRSSTIASSNCNAYVHVTLWEGAIIYNSSMNTRYNPW